MPVYRSCHDIVTSPPRLRRWLVRLAVTAGVRWGTSIGIPGGQPRPAGTTVEARHSSSHLGPCHHDHGPPVTREQVAGILARWRGAARELQDPRRCPVAVRARGSLAVDVAVPYLRAYGTLPALLRHYLEERWEPMGAPAGGPVERPVAGTVEYWVEVACQAFPAGASRRQRELVEHAAFWWRFRQLVNASAGPQRTVRTTGAEHAPLAVSASCPPCAEPTFRSAGDGGTDVDEGGVRTGSMNVHRGL